MHQTDLGWSERQFNMAQMQHYLYKVIKIVLACTIRHSARELYGALELHSARELHGVLELHGALELHGPETEYKIHNCAGLT
jgi:hypothetical protein